MIDKNIISRYVYNAMYLKYMVLGNHKVDKFISIMRCQSSDQSKKVKVRWPLTRDKLMLVYLCFPVFFMQFSLLNALAHPPEDLREWQVGGEGKRQEAAKVSKTTSP